MKTVLRIRSVSQNGFRRCGIHHPPVNVDHPLDRFTEAETKRLATDPNLVCIPVEADDDPAQSDGPADRIGAIKAAIGTLDKENPAHFTQAGDPKVEAIEAVVGWNLSAGERSTAWAEIQAETNSS